MKSNSTLRVVETNSQTTKDFTIQASGKMFHMVISGLYSDKPKSITREIWSNAFDAHAMVGKEAVPFEVTFPTAITPTFTCRDFGPGIAHDDMEGFYTVLGHSTKENTNKAVGKWGVGRMSPMSYTDTFSVVSRHKGMVSYYAVQLGPDGSPQLHVLAEPQPTADPDGLEVSFPVKRQDIQQFQTAANVISVGFDVPPVVTNSKEKSFSPLKKLYEGKDYYLYEHESMNGAYAQMGCVLYPIPYEYLPKSSWHGRSIVYKFDIGDLEVTASREALSFGPNDPTAGNIKIKTEIVEQQLFDALQAEVEAQPKLFLAAKLAPKLRRFIRSGDFKWKGLQIPKVWNLAKYQKVSLHCGYKGYRQKTAGFGLDKDLSVTEDHTIFIQDTSDKKGCARAATRICSTIDSYKYYIWIRADLTDKEQKAEVDTLIAELDFPVLYVKDLQDDGPKQSGPRAKVTVSRLTHNNGLNKHDMDDATFKAGGYYFPMSNNDIPYHIRRAHTVSKDKFGKDVVFVPKTLWKKFEGQSNWISFEPALKKLVEEEAPNVRKVFGNKYNIYPFTNFRSLSEAGGVVGEFAKKVSEDRPSYHLGLVCVQWADILRHYSLPMFSNQGVEAEYKSLLDKYPLLTLGSVSENVKDFVRYVQLIDNAAKE
jgi:hypothetical protein